MPRHRSVRAFGFAVLWTIVLLAGVALHGRGQAEGADRQAPSPDGSAAPPAGAAAPASPGAAQAPAGDAAAPSTGARQSAPPSANAGTVQPPQASQRLYMPDGQLKSHQLAIYVTGTIAAAQKPRLRLIRSHALTTADASEARPLEPTLVAAGQEWIETIEGRQVAQSGTILLFDASDVPFGIRAMVRVRPALTWTDTGGAERTLLGQRDVNVGHIVTAVAWTAAVVLLSVAIVIALARRSGRSPVLLLTGVDGHLSLAQAQVACWTIAVGAVVLGYGLIRLDIPEIPESLLALMGASLLTGGVAYMQDAKREQAATGGLTPTAYRTWRSSDLVSVFSPGQIAELSLAKAQMLFWTVLLLALFVSKSVLEGRIWEVPWPLVALMGFSQAGYLAPKLAGQAPSTTSARTGGESSPSAQSSSASGTAAGAGATSGTQGSSTAGPPAP